MGSLKNERFSRSRVDGDNVMPVTVQWSSQARSTWTFHSTVIRLEKAPRPVPKRPIVRTADARIRTLNVTVRVYHGSAAVEELYVGGKAIRDYLSVGGSCKVSTEHGREAGSCELERSDLWLARFSCRHLSVTPPSRGRISEAQIGRKSEVGLARYKARGLCRRHAPPHGRDCCRDDLHMSRWVPRWRLEVLDAPAGSRTNASDLYCSQFGPSRFGFLRYRHFVVLTTDRSTAATGACCGDRHGK